MILGALCVMSSAAFSEGLEVHFLDVGQADAAVVICDNHVMLIDGGETESSQFIYSYLKQTMGIDTIDYVIP